MMAGRFVNVRGVFRKITSRMMYVGKSEDVCLASAGEELGVLFVEYECKSSGEESNDGADVARRRICTVEEEMRGRMLQLDHLDFFFSE